MIRRILKVPEPMCIDGVECIDMGKAGIWATCNIGANSPEETGLYFAWGETEGYTSEDSHDFSWNNYKFGTSTNLSKYNTVDSLSELELEDDAAHVIIGGDWKIPTADDFQLLIDSCNVIYTTLNEVNCVKFTSNNNRLKSIYIPRVRYKTGTKDASLNYGYLWTSNLRNNSTSTNIRYGQCFRFSTSTTLTNEYRYYGMNIRAFIPYSLNDI